MYPNLKAEQARRNMTNKEVAGCLSITVTSYEQKRRSGRFVVDEIRILCDLFNCPFEYLFATEAQLPKS